MEYSPGLGRAGGLSPESMIDQLYAAGLLPYQLGANEWTKESPSSSRQFEGQMHLIWIRAGKEKSLSIGDAANLFLPTDKAALLRLANSSAISEARPVKQLRRSPSSLLSPSTR